MGKLKEELRVKTHTSTKEQLFESLKTKTKEDLIISSLNKSQSEKMKMITVEKYTIHSIDFDPRIKGRLIAIAGSMAMATLKEGDFEIGKVFVKKELGDTDWSLLVCKKPLVIRIDDQKGYDVIYDELESKLSPNPRTKVFDQIAKCLGIQFDDLLSSQVEEQVK